MWSIRSSARILWPFQVLSTLTVSAVIALKNQANRSVPVPELTAAGQSCAKLCPSTACWLHTGEERPCNHIKGWTQFPRGTQAGYRSRVILSEEVLCDLTSATVTALTGSSAGQQRDLPRGSGSRGSLRAHCGSQGCDMARTSHPGSQLVEVEAAHNFQNF